jgi:ribosomal protein S18 acetylase RimI-like enzyme
MGPASVIAPARPHELEAAFELVFRYVAADERPTRIANALRLVEKGELDPAGILVASRGGELLGAVVYLPVPGASGLVWPAQAIEGANREAIEDALVRRATTALREQGARLAQSLLTEAELSLAGPLLRNGFAHVTALWYMQHELGASAGGAPAGRLTYLSYNQLSNPVLFHETLLRTYEDTRDCPEISGVRTADQIIAGHRAQGKYDPRRWILALAAGRPVGVLLLSEMPEWAAWDVAYVGVVPTERSRGYGRELMQKALAVARADGVARLTLSVDVRNERAQRLYKSLGFQTYDRREAILAIWR